MARAIDIQPIIEEIKSSLDISSYSEHDKGFDDGLEYVLDLIEKAPTLTPPNEWVSVKNKKPELGERVLATDGAFVGEGYMDCYGVWCRPNGMRWNMLESEVTHWMPLPAPPDRRPPEQIDMLERMESE